MRRPIISLRVVSTKEAWLPRRPVSEDGSVQKEARYQHFIIHKRYIEIQRCSRVVLLNNKEIIKYLPQWLFFFACELLELKLEAMHDAYIGVLFSMIGKKNYF